MKLPPLFVTPFFAGSPIGVREIGRSWAFSSVSRVGKGAISIVAMP